MDEETLMILKALPTLAHLLKATGKIGPEGAALLDGAKQIAEAVLAVDPADIERLRTL